MARKLFDDKLSEPISPLIDVVVNALAAIFIMLMIYMIVVRPSDDIEPLKFVDVKPPSIIQGQNYLYCFPVTGGSGKRKFKLIEGKLPDGLFFDNDIGTIYGVVLGNNQIKDKNQVSLKIEVSDTKNTDSITSVFDIYPYAIPHSPNETSFKILREATLLPPARIGTFYEAIIAAIGGIEPYSWEIINGNLPQGFEVTKDGKIIGTPQRPGTYKFKIRVKYSSGSFLHRNMKYEWSGRIAEKSYQLNILDSFQHKLHVPVGQVGEPYWGMLMMDNTIVGDYVKWNYKINGLSSIDGENIVKGTPLEDGMYDIVYMVMQGEKTIGEGKEKLIILPKRPNPSIVKSFYHGWIDEPLSCGIPYQGFREPVEVVPLSKLPDGLEMKNGIINGIVKQVALFEIPIKVEDQIGNSAIGNIYIRIEPKKSPLKIELQEEIFTIVNKPLHIELTASGGSREYQFSIKGDLPSNLNFIKNKITGYVEKHGKWNVETIVNDIITRETVSKKVKIYSLYDEETQPKLLTGSIPNAVLGEPYKFDMASDGGVGSIIFNFEGILPKGLIFTKTGISGTPNIIETKKFKVELSDKVAQKSGPYEFEISVVPPDRSIPVILTKIIPTAIYGKDYIVNFAAEGGVGKYRWLFSGELPSGLNFTQNGIAGAVKEKNIKNWRINASVQDEIGQKSNTIELILTTIFADESKPHIQTNGIPKAILGEAYEMNFSGNGGIGRLQFNFTGSLPEGLIFSESGISGIPKRVQNKTFTAILVDEVGQKAESRKFSISVVPSDSSIPAILTKSLPTAVYGKNYTQIFSAEGGVGKYRWEFSGKLPKGLKFIESGIDGIVEDENTGSWIISVIVKDEIGQQSEKVQLELNSFNFDNKR